MTLIVSIPEVDRNQWNEFLATIRPDRDSYFTTVWLYAECYMYRRLKSIFESSATLPTFDYFAKQKKTGLTSSYETIQFVVQHVSDFNKQPTPSVDQLKPFLIKLIKLSLWGNRCDLSISLGRQIQQEGNAFTALQSLDEYLLVDRCDPIWQCLLAGRQQPNSADNATIVDVVLDNSGYELFTDLVLVHFLLKHNFAGRVRFHVKAIPWFISDVMPADFAWTLEQLAGHSDAAVAQFGSELVHLQQAGRIEVRPLEYFWTGPWEFRRMAEVRPILYADLAQAHLVLFKGDLNYRKLLGDFNWDFGTAFETVLSGFRPTNVCSLRTVKADLVCELKSGVADLLKERDSMWMETGQYGVVHFAAKE